MPDVAIKLGTAYDFTDVRTASQALRPRGQLRIIVAEASGRPAAAFNATLFFSSLVCHPLYHELILTHYIMPREDAHGPFSVASIRPSDFAEISFAELTVMIGERLEYCRYGAEPIAAAVKSKVSAFVERLGGNVAGGRYRAFRLKACDAFNEPGNNHFQHEWSHALLEFHEYVLFDTQLGKLVCLMFAFD